MVLSTPTDPSPTTPRSSVSVGQAASDAAMAVATSVPASRSPASTAAVASTHNDQSAGLGPIASMPSWKRVTTTQVVRTNCAVLKLSRRPRWRRATSSAMVAPTSSPMTRSVGCANRSPSTSGISVNGTSMRTTATSATRNPSASIHQVTVTPSMGGRRSLSTVATSAIAPAAQSAVSTATRTGPGTARREIDCWEAEWVMSAGAGCRPGDLRVRISGPGAAAARRRSDHQDRLRTE